MPGYGSQVCANNPRSMSVPTIQTVKGRVVFFRKVREKISTKRIQEQKNLDILREWHKLAAHSRSIEEFERLILKVPLG